MKNNAAYALLTVGAILAAVGVFMGQYGSVLAKAVKICMECIGIG